MSSPVPFDAFDSVRIINLAYRTDRRAEMIAELRRVGLEGDRRVSFFDARTFDVPGTFRTKGERGCYASHLDILQEAAAQGHSVLIFEDDLNFENDAKNYRMPDGWAIFYGAYYALDADDLPNSDIVGSHFMGFSAEAAKAVAAYLSDLIGRADQPPIDGAYVWFRRAHPEFETVFARPLLGSQRPSRSDVGELRFFDRAPILRQAASIGRRIKRSLRHRNADPAKRDLR